MDNGLTRAQVDITKQLTADVERLSAKIERLTAALRATLPTLHSCMSKDDPPYSTALELTGVAYDPRGRYEQSYDKSEG